jgi:hypothetical protein
MSILYMLRLSALQDSDYYGFYTADILMHIFKINVIIAIVAGAIMMASHAFATPLSVTVINATVPTKCAEEDNVYIKLQSPDVTKFTFDAVQPVYAAKVRFNRRAPDFTNCTFGPLVDAQKAKSEVKTPVAIATPPAPFKPASQVLYEDADIIINGIRYPDFWRKTPVPLVIDGKPQENWHLLQVFTKRSKLRGKNLKNMPFEYLVLYPQDGYWRSRMMPVKGRAENVYGASFLIGPVDEIERPFVEIATINIDPKARRFDLVFAKGGKGKLEFGEPTPTSFSVNVVLERSSNTLNQPFAAVRSMFVSETNADSARLMVRATPSSDWKGDLLSVVKEYQAMQVKIDRVVPSKHNTLSPDFVFRNFTK